MCPRARPDPLFIRSGVTAKGKVAAPRWTSKRFATD
jgi:hypothetical protein